MHSLQQKVTQVQRAATRRLWALGVSLVVMSTLAATSLLGMVDWWVRIDDHGLRWLCWLIVIATAMVAIAVCLVPLWRNSISELETARRIESRFPVLQDRLTSTLEFLRTNHHENNARSSSLRQTVAAQTHGLGKDLDFRDALSPTPLWWTIGAACVVLLFALGMLALDASTVALAARRLAAPWSDDPWPKRFPLAFRSAPARIAVGDDFEAIVYGVRGRLPKRVEFEYRLSQNAGPNPQSSAPSESPPLFENRVRRKPMEISGDEMRLRLNHVTQTMLYRARGGDDQDMPWQRLEVVPPPKVRQFEIVVHPPAYTNQPPVVSSHDIQALEQSQVEIVRGQATEPLQAARLVVQQGSTTRSIPLQLDAAKTAFTLPVSADPPWVLKKSGRYSFELVNLQEITGQSEQSWDVRVAPDTPPTISVETDAAVRYATPQSTLPRRVIAKDDLAVKRVELRIEARRPSFPAAVEQPSVVLYQGPEKMLPRETGDTADVHEIEYAWRMPAIAELAPGWTLSYYFAAVDYKGQWNESPRGSVAIIPREEMEDRLSQRLAFLLAALSKTLQMQRGVLTDTRSLEIQLHETGALRKGDVDHLQSTEMSQRQVAEMVAGGKNAALRQVDQLLQMARNHLLDTPQRMRRLAALQRRLTAIQSGPLTTIQTNLMEAIRHARTAIDTTGKNDAHDGAAPNNAGPFLTNAAKDQAVVVTELAQIVADLSQWDHYRRFAVEVRRFRQEQEAVREKTAALHWASLSEQESEIQRRADERRLSNRQRELAASLSAMLQQMEQLRPSLKAAEPLAAEMLGDAIDVVRRRAIHGQMDEAARELDRRQPGAAEPLMKQALGGLDELLDVLGRRPDNVLQRLLKKRIEADDRLRDLSKRQHELTEKVAQASQIEDPKQARDALSHFAKQQTTLANEIERLGRHLERLQSAATSRTVNAAADTAKSAAQAARSGNAEPAADRARQTEENLRRARQTLAKALEQTRQSLARRQNEQRKVDLQAIITRQEAVIAEIEKLQAASQDNPSQVTVVAPLADVQRQLSEKAKQFSQGLTQTPALELGIQGAARWMVRAAGRLDRRDYGPITLRSATTARSRLAQVLQAIEDEAKAKTPSESSSQSSEKDPPGQNDRQPGAILPQLQYLKLVQKEIHQRTQEIERNRSQSGDLSADQQRELDELIEEQGDLAELSIKLSEITNQHSSP